MWVWLDCQINRKTFSLHHPSYISVRMQFSRYMRQISQLSGSNINRINMNVAAPPKRQWQSSPNSICLNNNLLLANLHTLSSCTGAQVKFSTVLGINKQCHYFTYSYSFCIRISTQKIYSFQTIWSSNQVDIYSIAGFAHDRFKEFIQSIGYMWLWMKIICL